MPERSFAESKSAGTEVFRFHLSLMSDDDTLYDLWLPNVAEGIFYFSDKYEHRCVYLFGMNGLWYAGCRQPAYFSNVPLENCYETLLADGQFLEVNNEDRIYHIYTEAAPSERRMWHSYSVNTDTDITIGRSSRNTICYNNPYIAPQSAVLRRKNGQWELRSCDLVCAVYVNKIRRESMVLKLGDVISTMGLKIIIGANTLAISGNMDRIVVGQPLCRCVSTERSGYPLRYTQNTLESAESFFSRLPRKRLDVGKKLIRVEAPPMSMKRAQIPLLLRMGSSMVMGGSGVLHGNYTSILSSVLFPLLNSKYSEKEQKEYEQLRVTKYTEYLESKRKEILNACQEEHDLLNKKYPPLRQIIESARNKKNLWERRPVDNDFLQVRLGAGTKQMDAEIEYPVRRFELEPDEMEEKMYQLVEAPHVVQDCPMMISLLETNVCGVQGRRSLVLRYVQEMVLQLAISHSYDEVKMCFLVSPKELELLDQVRYLPHVWDEQRSIRFIATSEAEVYTLGEHIKAQIAPGLEGKKASYHGLNAKPHYLIFALSEKLVDCHEVLKEIQQSGNNPGASLIAAYAPLPKDVQKIITLHETEKCVCTSLDADGGEDTLFSRDWCDPEDIEKIMRMMANTRLQIAAQAQEMPTMVTFLEMFRVGRVGQLNAFKRWCDNNPTKSLAAPVGVGEDGSLFMLDLHEKRQGPHGLVAGMTGSGKSEFLITYILSMAVNYHPDEVAFLLIDYKGGGLADAFENPQTGVRLPHLVGTITNLDGASIQRSLMSIESELMRRQRVFHDIKSTVNEGTMDIYAYQKLYRAGKVAEPMPHLFIVSDEFAELKQQQPEFMDRLISAARIGRSLGIHLILATQKPSGVVNDQIWSNTKFRVCLKVQDRGDSYEMLKRNEAAELTNTGRFYLQVGYNEFFAVGQSAWCGAPYEPQEYVSVKRDSSIVFLDVVGQSMAQATQKVKKSASGLKQIVAVVKYLSDIATNESIRAKLLWQPQLPAQLALADIQRQYGDASLAELEIPVGVVDDPVNQVQYPLVLSFQKCKNTLLVGDSGSGKTTFVQTIIYSLATKFSPEQVNFYILDFSSRNMKMFQGIPHCGAILLNENENDVERLLTLLENIVLERKKLFSDVLVSSYESYVQIHSLPVIILFVDNINGFNEFKKGRDFLSRLSELMRNGSSYGVICFVTAGNINDMPYRMQRDFAETLSLHAKDGYAYSNILNARCRIEPSETPGRGVCVSNGGCCEYQAALVVTGKPDQERQLIIQQAMEKVSDKYQGYREALALEISSPSETYKEFCRKFKPERIPLGYCIETGQKVAIPLQQLNSMLFYFGNQDGTRMILENMLHIAKREAMQVHIVKRLHGSIFGQSDYDLESSIILHDCTTPAISDFLTFLRSLFTERTPIRNDFCKKSQIEAWQDVNAIKLWRKIMRQETVPILVIFESVSDLMLQCGSEEANAFKTFFGMGTGYNVYYIGCYYDRDEEMIQGQLSGMDADQASEFRHILDTMRTAFLSEKNCLLFGGQYNKQKLVSLPYEFDRITAPCEQAHLDRFLLYYRNRIVKMRMPCGEITMQATDDDEKSII